MFYAPLTALHGWASRTTAGRAEPVPIERVPLKRGVADLAKESSTVRENREVRGGGSGDVVAHFVRGL